MVSFQSPLCQSLYEYWLGLPKPSGALLPLKSSLDPAVIPRLLPRLVLHDLRQPGRSIMRVVGTGLAEQYGFDPTGHDYTDLVAADRRGTALRELVKIARYPCGMRVAMEHLDVSDMSILSEAAGFPFEADDGGGRFLLFVDSIIEGPTFHDPRCTPLHVLRVQERAYIDIGAGVPPAME